MRLISPDDLWAQRCGELDEESALALGDGVPRLLEGDLAPMHTALERLPVEARARARRVLDQVRYEVCSPVETRLRLILVRAGVPETSHSSAPIPREGRAEVWPDLQRESVRVGVEAVPRQREVPQAPTTARTSSTSATSDAGDGDGDGPSAMAGHVVVSSREVMGQPDDVVGWISDELRRAGLRW